jgi:hypothetical protein
MSDTEHTPTCRDMAVRHGIPIADVVKIDQVAANDIILDAACAARARGATVEQVVAAMREVGLDGAVGRLSGLRELNG